VSARAAWVRSSHRPSTAIPGRILLGVLLASVVQGCWSRSHGRPHPTTAAISAQPGMVSQEAILPPGRFPMCHASTIAESAGALVVAWFAGSHEGARDVAIWISRKEPGASWSAPLQVADGIQSPTSRLPCWNPVLFQPSRGPLVLFHKVGPDPRHWWGLRMDSGDGGRTWSRAERLPDGRLGPSRNQPLERADGTWLCPGSSEEPGLLHLGARRALIESTPDQGRTWTAVAPLDDSARFAAIQPTLLRHPAGRLQALCRSRQGVITQAWSADDGATWQAMTATTLPNPDSGIAAVTLRDGRHLLAYNHQTSGREFLTVAISADGVRWRAALVLADEPGEYSYPAVIQAGDGLVHLTYTWRRRNLRHVVIDPERLVPREFARGEWPR
jgi:predicted neuraminidase